MILILLIKTDIPDSKTDVEGNNEEEMQNAN